MMNFTVQIGQVESVRDILLIDFTEVLVSFATQKPRHPRASVVAVAR